MDKLIFTFTYLKPTVPPGAGPDIFTEVKSSEFDNLPEFFKSYLTIYAKGFKPLLTVDPVIDIEKVAEAVSKCFNLVYQAQNNLTNAHNLLVNLHKELLKHAGK